MPAAVAAAGRHQPEYGDGSESPVADRESPAAGRGNPDILTELSGSPLPERPALQLANRGLGEPGPALAPK